MKYIILSPPTPVSTHPSTAAVVVCQLRSRLTVSASDAACACVCVQQYNSGEHSRHYGDIGMQEKQRHDYAARDQH